MSRSQRDGTHFKYVKKEVYKKWASSGRYPDKSHQHRRIGNTAAVNSVINSGNQKEIDKFDFKGLSFSHFNLYNTTFYWYVDYLLVKYKDRPYSELLKTLGGNPPPAHKYQGKNFYTPENFLVFSDSTKPPTYKEFILQKIQSEDYEFYYLDEDEIIRHVRKKQKKTKQKYSFEALGYDLYVNFTLQLNPDYAFSRKKPFNLKQLTWKQLKGWITTNCKIKITTSGPLSKSRSLKFNNTGKSDDKAVLSALKTYIGSDDFIELISSRCSPAEFITRLMPTIHKDKRITPVIYFNISNKQGKSTISIADSQWRAFFQTEGHLTGCLTDNQFKAYLKYGAYIYDHGDFKFLYYHLCPGGSYSLVKRTLDHTASLLYNEYYSEWLDIHHYGRFPSKLEIFNKISWAYPKLSIDDFVYIYDKSEEAYLYTELFGYHSPLYLDMEQLHPMYGEYRTEKSFECRRLRTYRHFGIIPRWDKTLPLKTSIAILS